MGHIFAKNLVIHSKGEKSSDTMVYLTSCKSIRDLPEKMDTVREDRWVTFGLLQQISFSADAASRYTQVNIGCLGFNVGEITGDLLPTKKDFEGGITFFFEDFGQFPPIPHKVIILDHNIKPIGAINRADFSCDVTTNKTKIELYYWSYRPVAEMIEQLPSWIKKTALDGILHE